MIPEVLRQLETQGYKGRIVPARRLRDMQVEIDAQYRQGLPLDQLPSALAEKVAQFDIVSLLEVLPRNLEVLLQERKDKDNQSTHLMGKNVPS